MGACPSRNWAMRLASTLRSSGWLDDFRSFLEGVDSSRRVYIRPLSAPLQVFAQFDINMSLYALLTAAELIFADL